MAVVCHTSSKTICREKYLYITRLCICKLLVLGMWLKTLYWKYCIMTTHIFYKEYPEADKFKAVDKKYHFYFTETYRKISWMTLIRISFLPIPYFIWSSLKGKKSKYVKFERGILKKYRLDSLIEKMTYRKSTYLRKFLSIHNRDL